MENGTNTEKTLPAHEQQIPESQKLWQEYLQKCCEVGQLLHAIDQLDSQKRELEKNLEVTQRAVKSLAAKHRENQSQSLSTQKQAIENQTDNAGALQ